MKNAKDKNVKKLSTFAGRFFNLLFSLGEKKSSIDWMTTVKLGKMQYSYPVWKPCTNIPYLVPKIKDNI